MAARTRRGTAAPLHDSSPALTMLSRDWRHRSRRNLLIGMVEAMLATPWIFLTVPGNFIFAALLTQHFGIGKAAYGWIVAMPAMANAIQIVMIPWLARFLTPKDLAVSFGWFNLGLWTMLTLSVSHLPKADVHGAAIFFGVFFIFSALSGAFVGIGWTAWVRNWVPRRVQGRYFGNRNRWISLVTLAFLLLAMLLFWLGDGSLWPFQTLLIIAVACRFIGLLWQQGISAPADLAPATGEPWLVQFRANLLARSLLRFILFSAWISFWIAFTGPFVPVFSFEELGVQPHQFSLFVVLSTAAAMAGWVFWGRLADRRGSIPILALGIILWETSNLAWIFVGPRTVWILYPLWLWGGFVSVSYWLCSFNLLLNLLPKNARVAGSSLNLALTSAAATAGPVLAGWLLQHFLEGAQNRIDVYRAGFAIKSFAIFLSLLFVRGLTEPHRTARTGAPGAFATLRMILSGQGPGFLANLIPQREAQEKRKNTSSASEKRPAD